MRHERRVKILMYSVTLALLLAILGGDVLAQAEMSSVFATGDTPVILVVGDSVTAGYGLRPDQAFPALLQSLLTQAGQAAEVINAGVSGDTTADGLARLPKYFPPNSLRRPDLMILELGANDAIQRKDLAQVEANLDAMLALALGHGTRVLLTGIGAGLKRNDTYRGAFVEIFKRLSHKHGVRLYPLIGEGIRGNPALVLEDGVHPNAEGARVIASGLLPLALELLREKHTDP